MISHDDDVSIDELPEVVEHMHSVPARLRVAKRSARPPL
jgi:hypothetical protein